MKKILTYVLIIMLLIAGVFILTGCSSNENKDEAEDVSKVNAEIEKIEVVPTTDHTKWPSGVYGAYGLPEYTSGTLQLAVPGEVQGTAFIKTTYNEFKAYVDGLLDKGYRMTEDDKDLLEYFDYTDKSQYNSIAVELYDPKPGKGYVVEVQYFAKEQTHNVIDGEFDGVEPFSYEFNLLMWIEERTYSEEKKDTNLLTKYGISDEVVVPDFKTYTIEKNEDDKGRININIDAGYDYEFSNEEINNYKTRLANEILKISDDGKMYDMSGDRELVSEEDKLIGYYLFKYQGAEYRCYCEVKAGLSGGRMAVGIEPK